MKLFHAERGNGVPVVAVHGWAPDHRLMLGCLEPIFERRDGYRRLYPDLPGLGRSATAPEVASSDAMVSAVLEFIDQQVGRESFILVGESYGGYLARGIVRARPSQVLGLGLICPVGEPRRELRTLPSPQVLRSDPGVLDGLDPQLAQSFTGLAVVQTRETLRRFLAEVQPGLDLADWAALARVEEHWLLSQDPDAEGLPPFEGPSLMLLGRQDIAVGYLDQLALLAQYPRASVAILDVAGHNLQIEQPLLFAALIEEWLDRIAAAV